jgi:hypothetical protein
MGSRKGERLWSSSAAEEHDPRELVDGDER